MSEKETLNLEFSGWWGVATFALMLSAGMILMARTMGTQAVETLMRTALLLVFVLGGILLGMLIFQALGASQHWGLSEQLSEPDTTDTTMSQLSQQHAKQPLSRTHERTETSATVTSVTDKSVLDHSPLLDEEDEVDPFYEILKQKRTPGKVA